MLQPASLDPRSHHQQRHCFPALASQTGVARALASFWMDGNRGIF